MYMAIADELDRLIVLSEEFESELLKLFDRCSFPSDNKSTAVLAMCDIALEHAISQRELIRTGMSTSAIGLLRLQYEAVVRAIWVLYAATDSATAKLIAPLTPENEQSASNSIPSFSNMLNDLGKKGPPAVHRLLTEFKDYSWRALNSFVHGGIHAVNRNREGYPTALLIQSIRQSNNLTHMAGMSLTGLLKDSELTYAVVDLHKKYAECLLLKPSRV